MSLIPVLEIIVYACAVVFALSVATRFIKIARMPMHVRWELYPVAHEKGKAHYGGSMLEELDWWTKPQEKSLLGELKVMVPEILLLEGVHQRNRSHWFRTFPFHFGLYLLIGATVLLVGAGIAEAAGADFGSGAGWLASLTMTMIKILGYLGFGLGLYGALSLLVRRLFEEQYREYTSPLDYLNLVFFVAAFGVALAAHLISDPDFTLMRGFFAGLITLGGYDPVADLSGIAAVQVVLLALLAAYVPLTHMSHFFTKYFMYHDIRWGDEPLKVGGKLEATMLKTLGMKPTWAAAHIAGDGKKTWVDIATSTGQEEPAAESEPKS